MVRFDLNGVPTEFAQEDGSLLDALRGLGVFSVKDGCAPQGQCGCCTVLVDGKPRVACVTPLRRVQGRSIETLEGLEPEVRDRWADAFFATGASQCGFCSPGIIMRLEGARRDGSLPAKTTTALAAHVCRCTGYQPIFEAADLVTRGEVPAIAAGRDRSAAELRAEIEGGVPQRCGPSVALGLGNFADDTSPAGSVVLYPDAEGGFVQAESVAEARRLTGKVQGRNTTSSVESPFDIPDVPDAVLRLRTAWVEPAYLEPDCAWAHGSGEGAGPLGNGGAFGGKTNSDVVSAATEFARETGQATTCVFSREEVVRRGPKRPPLALAIDEALRGVVVVAAAPGVEELVRSVLPEVEVRVEQPPGPPVSLDLRGAVWAELTAAKVLVEQSGVREPGAAVTVSLGGATARVVLDPDRVVVEVDAGDPLDVVTLRSYCIGAVHMALGQVWTEGIAVGEDGGPLDLTFRSFGLLRPGQIPPCEVRILPSTASPARASDCVYAACLAAAWAAAGTAESWPTGIPPEFQRAR